MTSKKLPIGKTIWAALRTPFFLDRRSWLSLGLPVGLLGIALLSLWTVNYLRWHELVQVLAWLMVLFAANGFALRYLRLLLLGPPASPGGFRNWRRDVLSFLAFVALSLLFGALLGLLLSFLLPAMAGFVLAVNSATPWLALGAVLLGLLALGGASYLVARLVLILPALAVDHSAGIGRIWRLSRGNGLRLAVVLFGFPGLMNPFLVRVITEAGGPWWELAGTAFDIFITLLVLGLLGMAYRKLSDLPLTGAAASQVERAERRSTRVVGLLGYAILFGTLAVLIWRATYWVETGERVTIWRGDRPDRVITEPGLQFKSPLGEEARRETGSSTHEFARERQYFTALKETVPIKFVAIWRVQDSDLYVRTTGGDPSHAGYRIGDVAVSLLRERVATQTRSELLELIPEAGLELDLVSPAAGTMATRPDAVPLQLNTRIRELGIEVVKWRLEMRREP